MKRNILKIIFVVWIALWAMFFVRELFIKSNMRDYRALLFRSLDGKRSYVMGDKSYDFLKYCMSNMPARATYKMIGIDAGDLDVRRAVYYLYPRLENKDPDFIIDMEQYTLKRVRE